MRITYSAYEVVSETKHYLVDLRSLVNVLSLTKDALPNAGSSEECYLSKITKDRYLFIERADPSIVKLIKQGKAKASEITERLREDETLGLASIIGITERVIAIGCRQGSPRLNKFANIMDYVLNQKFKNKRFAFLALTDSMSRGQALTLEKASGLQASFKVESTFFEELRSYIPSFEPIRELGYEAFEIRPIPFKKGRVNSASLVKSLLKDEHASNALAKLKTRIHNEEANATMETYIVGMGQVHNFSTGKTDLDHANAMFTDEVIARLKTLVSDFEKHKGRIAKKAVTLKLDQQNCGKVLGVTFKQK